MATLGRRPIQIHVTLTQAARKDLEAMYERAHANPHSMDEALYEATMTMLRRLDGRRHPTKPLDYNKSFADLSDCDTTYVGADPYDKPPLRIVSRDRLSRNVSGSMDREIIAIGERQDSEVYKIAGERLRRPIGRTLESLVKERDQRIAQRQQEYAEQLAKKRQHPAYAKPPALHELPGPTPAELKQAAELEAELEAATHSNADDSFEMGG